MPLCLPLLLGASDTFLYRCGDDFHFTARFEKGGVWLFLPKRSVKLPFIDGRHPGEKRFSEGSVSLAVEGESAVLLEGGRVHASCRNDRRAAIWEKAKLDGVDFRAVGNEPPWILEITGDRFDFFYGYGKKRFSFRAKPRVDRDKSETRYVADAGGTPFEVTLRPDPCRDSMADETYETRVEVVWKARRLMGCGMALHCDKLRKG